MEALKLAQVQQLLLAADPRVQCRILRLAIPSVKDIPIKRLLRLARYREGFADFLRLLQSIDGELDQQDQQDQQGAQEVQLLITTLESKTDDEFIGEQLLTYYNRWLPMLTEIGNQVIDPIILRNGYLNPAFKSFLASLDYVWGHSPMVVSYDDRIAITSYVDPSRFFKDLAQKYPEGLPYANSRIRFHGNGTRSDE